MIASIPYKFGIALYHTNSMKAITGKGDSIEDTVFRRYHPEVCCCLESLRHREAVGTERHLQVFQHAKVTNVALQWVWM
jgi:hypothetical protein